MNNNRWFKITAVSLALTGSAILLNGCGEGEAPRQMPPQQVQIVVAKTESIDITTTLPARTNAYRIANISPQVNGTILKREFIEGSDVVEGQSLYLINPAVYQATYNSAKASLASAKANAEVSRLTFNRYKSLLGNSSISRQDYDNAAATYAQATASVEVAKAGLDNAEINLAYTKVYSPITGRIGKSNVTEGALVGVGQVTPLATVQQLDPMYVDMTQSATDYLRLKESTLKRQDGKSPVTLTLENGQVYPLQGVLEFSDVTVNETTGSISLRAVFPNPDHLLLPGMFVRATVSEGSLTDIFLLPQKAVTRDVRGNTSVKIVGQGNVIETREIKVTEAIGSNWIVTEGLKDGDQVVTVGLQKIADKAVVEIKSDAPPAQKVDGNPAKSPEQK